MGRAFTAIFLLLFHHHHCHHHSKHFLAGQHHHFTLRQSTMANRARHSTAKAFFLSFPFLLFISEDLSFLGLGKGGKSEEKTAGLFYFVGLAGSGPGLLPYLCARHDWILFVFDI